MNENPSPIPQKELTTGTDIQQNRTEQSKPRKLNFLQRHPRVARVVSGVAVAGSLLGVGERTAQAQDTTPPLPEARAVDLDEAAPSEDQRFLDIVENLREGSSVLETLLELANNLESGEKATFKITSDKGDVVIELSAGINQTSIEQQIQSAIDGLARQLANQAPQGVSVDTAGAQRELLDQLTEALNKGVTHLLADSLSTTVTGSAMGQSRTDRVLVDIQVVSISLDGKTISFSARTPDGKWTEQNAEGLNLPANTQELVIAVESTLKIGDVFTLNQKFPGMVFKIHGFSDGRYTVDKLNSDGSWNPVSGGTAAYFNGYLVARSISPDGITVTFTLSNANNSAEDEEEVEATPTPRATQAPRTTATPQTTVRPKSTPRATQVESRESITVIRESGTTRIEPGQVFRLNGISANFKIEKITLTNYLILIKDDGTEVQVAEVSSVGVTNIIQSRLRTDAESAAVMALQSDFRIQVSGPIGNQTFMFVAK